MVLSLNARQVAKEHSNSALSELYSRRRGLLVQSYRRPMKSAKCLGLLVHNFQTVVQKIWDNEHVNFQLYVRVYSFFVPDLLRYSKKNALPALRARLRTYANIMCGALLLHSPFLFRFQVCACVVSVRAHFHKLSLTTSPASRRSSYETNSPARLLEGQ